MARKKPEVDIEIPVEDLAKRLTADLKKAFKDDSVTAYCDAVKEEIMEWYSTGIPSLDVALGGGLAGEHVSMFYGTYSCGKSATAYSALAASMALYPNKIHILADPENSSLMAKEHMEKLGVDTSAPNFIIISRPDSKPMYAEDIFERLEDILKQDVYQGRIGLIVLDSIGALVSKMTADNDNKWDKAPRVGGITQTVNLMISTIVDSGLLARCGGHLLLLNQARDNIGDMWNPIKFGGGKKLQHCADQIIYVDATKPQEFKNPKYEEGNPDEPTHIGQRVKYKVIKNKTGGKRDATASVDYYAETGFDIYKNIMDMAEFKKLLTAGAWKSLLNPVTGEVIAKYQGANRWKEALANNEKLWGILYLMTTLTYQGVAPEVIMEQVLEEYGDLEIVE